MKNLKYVLMGGILSWCLPFVFSFLLFDQNGQPVLDIFFTKTILMLVGCLVGISLLLWVFDKSGPGIMHIALLCGTIWPGVNWLLDLFVLLPMTGQTYIEYFQATGLRYLVIAMIAMAMGWCRRQANLDFETS